MLFNAVHMLSESPMKTLSSRVDPTSCLTYIPNPDPYKLMCGISYYTPSSLFYPAPPSTPIPLPYTPSRQWPIKPSVTS